MKIYNNISLAILGAGLLASSTVMAATDPAKFQAEKTREIGFMQQRLQIVQERLSCVEAAADHNALKTCHQTAKTKMQALENQVKAQRTPPH